MAGRGARTLIAGAVVAVCLAAAAGGAAGAQWTVYHANRGGSGAYRGAVSLSHIRRVWQSPSLSGQLYGEPLVSGKYVYVATTADVVYALNAADGSVAWSTTVGTPVSASSLPCGDISPTVGIVGTPVIDPRRHEIFAVADELVSGSPSHHLVGLDTRTGEVMLDEAVDPPGATPSAQLQRTGLNLASGSVVFGMGGNAGDCSTYHGWVVSVPEGGGEAQRFEVDREASEGAIWMGGAAPVVDGHKNVWVASGNGSNSSGETQDSDSVLKLSASMERLDSFTPSSWAQDNEADLDLGSTAPALLSHGMAVQVGKSQTAYVLRQKALGGVGGQLSSLAGICGTTFDGGSAISGSTVYLPCRNGPISATVSREGELHVNWAASVSSAGPPILAGGFVWVMDNVSQLDGLDPATGALAQQVQVGAVANHFPTPSVGDGLLLAPAANSVVAFGE